MRNKTDVTSMLTRCVSRAHLSKCGPGLAALASYGNVLKRRFPVPTQTCQIRICSLARFPRDSCAQYGLRSSDLIWPRRKGCLEFRFHLWPADRVSLNKKMNKVSYIPPSHPSHHADFEAKTLLICVIAKDHESRPQQQEMLGGVTQLLQASWVPMRPRTLSGRNRRVFKLQGQRVGGKICLSWIRNWKVSDSNCDTQPH